MRGWTASRWCIVSITLLGAALRLSRLAAQSLWFDEVFSWLCASTPLAVGLRFALLNFVHPPLYYLLLRPFVILHHSEYMLRWLSATIGIVAVPLIYQVGRRLAGRVPGLLAAALLAVNPFHVWYSREARMYTCVFLLALLCGYLFQRTLAQGRMRNWVALGIVSGLAYVTHYFCLLLPLTQFVYLLLNFRQRYRLLRPWVLVQALAGLPLAVWFYFLFSQPEKSMGIGWIPRPRVWDPVLTLWNFSLGSPNRLSMWVVLGLLPFAVALIRGLQSSPHRLWWALWLMWPLLFTLGLSWGLGRYFYVDRFFIVCLPAYLLLVAQGAGALPRRGLRLGLVAALLLASVLATLRLDLDPDLIKEDWRGALAYVNTHARSGDQVLLRNLEEVALLDYYGCEVPWAVIGPVPTADVWTELTASGGRFWLVYLHPGESAHLVGRPWPFDIYADADAATAAWLTTHREAVVEHHSLTGIDVLLLEVGPNSGGEP